MSQPRADAAHRIDAIDLLAHARRRSDLDAKQLSSVNPQ